RPGWSSPRWPGRTGWSRSTRPPSSRTEPFRGRGVSHPRTPVEYLDLDEGKPLHLGGNTLWGSGGRSAPGACHKGPRMTFSLLARCPETGAFGMVISSSSPAVAARCAHARAGVGVAATQNITDPALG